MTTSSMVHELYPVRQGHRTGDRSDVAKGRGLGLDSGIQNGLLHISFKLLIFQAFWRLEALGVKI